MSDEDEQAQLLAADVGPDDPKVGTADDATTQPEVPEKPEVPIAEPDKGVSTTETADAPPVTQPDPEEGQPEVKPDETPEDIKKSRAYHQAKSQEETELRKQLQADLDQMNTDLRAADPSGSFDADFVESAPGQTPAVPGQPDAVDDYGQIDSKKLTSDITQNVLGALDARDEKLRQQRIDYAYKQETDAVVTRFSAFVAKYKIPDDVVNDALKYSQRFVNQAALGAPTKRVELAGEYIQREMADRAVTERRELATKANADADDGKIEAAKALVQPASGPISPPAPLTPDALNDQLADDVVPDDTFD